jgi:hypothetical protein
MGNVWTKITRQDASDDAMIVDDQQYPVFPAYHTPDYPTACNEIYGEDPVSYELLNDGSRRKAGENREKMRSTCGEWIDLGNVETGEMALTNHEGKKRCLAKVESNKKELELRITAAALEDLRQNGTVFPRTPRHSQPFKSPMYSPTPQSFFSAGSSRV